MVGTDFPYRDWYPDGQDRHPARRPRASTSAAARRCTTPWSVTPAATLRTCSSALDRRTDRAHLETSPHGVRSSGTSGSSALLDPDHDDSAARAGLRAVFDNPDERIRPEALAAAVDRHARRDTRSSPPTPGMSTVWLSRFVTMRGTRRLVGSYNLGSMANAMPQALGAQALDRTPPGRRVLRRRRADDAARRPAHRRHLPAAGRRSSSSTTAGSAWSSSSRSRAACRSSAPSSTTPTSPPSPRRSGCTRRPRRRSPTSSTTPSRGARHRRPGAARRRHQPRRGRRPAASRQLAQAWGFAIAKAKETMESR